jgi:hypothetical protein
MTLSALGIFSAAGAGGGVAGDYELIESQILGSSQASVVFSSLATYASTYKHLQVRMATRTTSTSFNRSDLIMRINADTGNNYAAHYLFGSGSSVGSANDINVSWMYVGSITTNLDTTGSFAGGVLDLLDAYSTTKNKTTRSFSGRMGGSSPYNIGLNSSHWRNTASVTSLTFSTLDASSLVAGSRFSLYGIKG